MSHPNLEKAVSFVRNAGDPGLTRLAEFAVDECTREAAIEALTVNQREDGGWTRTDKDFQGDLSIITATFVALQWLNWLEDRDSPVLQNTLIS
jgi:hypothetical protein